MSGIAGIIFLDSRPVDLLQTKQMLASMAHRGPDGQILWCKNSVGIGQCVFNATSGIRPSGQVCKHGPYVLVADARIDNRTELLTQLSIHKNPDDITDDQLILFAYERWKENCAQKLLGAFAFAIWDDDRQCLFCARDHIGIKPFYYFHQPGRIFVFGSEIKALLTVSDTPKKLNEVRLADYLASILSNKENTFFDHIFRLPPAHTLLIDESHLCLNQYWSLDPMRKILYCSDQEYAEEFLHIFSEAIYCRLRGNDSLGFMLSGGLDSSSIACVARSLVSNDRLLHTFSVIYDQMSECDERPYIEAVLKQGGFTAHYIAGDKSGPLSDIDEMLSNMEEAFFGPNAYMHLALLRAAKKENIQVLMDGFDGDTAVSHGRRIIAEYLAAGNFRQAVSMARDLGKQTDRAFLRCLYNWGLVPLASPRIRQIWRLMNGRNPITGHSDWIISPEFSKRVGLAARVRAETEKSMQRTLNERFDHYRRLTHGSLPYVLELANKQAAVYGVEHRYPFCDRRLWEFCLSLPAQQKMDKGIDRVVCRRALQHLLPQEVSKRSQKANLGPNFDWALTHFDKDLMKKHIFDNIEAIQPYIDIKALGRIYSQYISGSVRQYGLPLWKVAVLAQWLTKTELAS